MLTNTFMESLLGQFYSRIRGSQEDIASTGLSYILNKSKGARDALQNVISNDTGINLPDLKYIAQSIGGNLERPDISGVTTTDENERLIIEAKFWASLTENQPLEYLKRIGVSSVLLFICPTLRSRSLYSEIKNRVVQIEIPEKSANDRLIVLPDNKYILIKTWDEILAVIKSNLVQEGSTSLVSDIDQLIGFCKVIDDNSFLPIQSDDLSPKYPRRLMSYCDLIDNLVEELRNNGKFMTEKLRATPQRDGYVRFGYYEKLALTLYFSMDLWSKNLDTPFWIGFQDSKNWATTPQLIESCHKAERLIDTKIFQKDRIYFPIFPKLDVTEDIVIKDMANQIVLLIDTVNDNFIAA